MKVLFCHDGPIKKDEKGNFYGIAHNNEMFKRYYTLGNELSVAMRVKHVSQSEMSERQSQITVSPFEVIECFNTSSLKGRLIHRKQNRKILENAVLNSDYIVARIPSVIGFIAIDVAKKHNKPYLIEVVACPWDAFWNHSLIGKIVAPYMYTATKKRVKQAKHVVYVTNAFLQKRYPTKGEQINCSNVILKNTDSVVLEKRLEKIHGMQNEKKIIIGTTAAVNVRYKGQQYIIEALGELKKQGINHFEYHLVGDGDKSFLQSVAIKNDVEDKVLFLGALKHSEIFDWLDTIDLYAQPSRQEGLPRALIEAMSRGLPSFGADTAGIPELLENKYVFSNSKNNIKEIIEILRSYDEFSFLNQSKRNYMESKKYNAEVIEARRSSFFERFKNA
ncbi:MULTISPECIES: glycosyltransferase family 4 protein [unclassified Exiguobacterium]|uniref:glycosyltransferase family 4 protein n=1 Tax=unclassified Exiguobacterium TaxID=2644629 RepID=UPI001BE72B06|nr:MULTISPECIES: glycosyltransferase family 4 protein [unclassified Exiguobacterium]